MIAMTAETVVLWPMEAYFVLAILLTVGMLTLSFLLGQHHDESQTGKHYEGGIESTGTAHLRFSVKFYLIAMFFVVFDIESVFIFSWAISLRETGWAGFIEAMIFIFVLVAALMYLWKLGALDIGTDRQRMNVVVGRKGVLNR
jgi:NADH-quinone oxidoreductase subunit A